MDGLITLHVSSIDHLPSGYDWEDKGTEFVYNGMMYDVIHLIASTITPPGTAVTATMRNTTGRTLEQSEGEFSLATVAKQKAFDLNTDYYHTAPQIVASQINETNEMSGSKSLNLVLTLSTPSGSDFLFSLFRYFLTSRLTASISLAGLIFGWINWNVFFIIFIFYSLKRDVF